MLGRGTFRAITVVGSEDMVTGKLEVETPWVLVDPRAPRTTPNCCKPPWTAAHEYVALRNTRQFVVSDTLVVNGPESPRNVEVIYGLMTDIQVDASLSARKPPYEQVNDRVLFLWRRDGTTYSTSRASLGQSGSSSQ